jgi:translation initiation factor 1
MTSQRDKGRRKGQEFALVYSTAGPVQTAVPAAKPLDPRRSQARIRLDRRAADRVVTVVTGIVGGADALAGLGRDLKSACGAGGTTKDGAIEIQGDHRETVERVLDARGFHSKRSGG